MKARIVRLLGVAEGQTSETGSGGLESELTSRRDEQNEIQLLDLTTNNVGDQECAAIAEFILGAGSSLAAVRLGGNKISSRGIERLVPSLRGASGLRELWLGNNSLGCSGVRALADGALRALVALEELWLCGVSLSDDGAVALGEALCDAPLPALRWLLLNNNHIGDDGAQALAAALPVLPRLAMLSLRCNAVGDRGAAAVALALQVAPSLQQLFLETNALSCVGIASVAAAAPHCATLTELRLGGMGLRHEGAQAVARMLPRVPRLECLGVAFGADEADLDGAAASIVRAIPSAPALRRVDGIDLCLHLHELGLPSTLHQTSSNHAIFQALVARRSEEDQEAGGAAAATAAGAPAAAATWEA